MAELRIYPNLPGVISSISVETQTPVFDDSKPKFLLIGWYSKDAFADGTPIKFNEPYYAVNQTMLDSMFGTDEKLGLQAKIVGETSGWEMIPVIVRVGKVDIKAGAGSSADAAKAQLAPVQANGNIQSGGIKIEWVGEPTWRENFVVKVTTGKEIYINDQDEPVNDLSAFGLKVTLPETVAEDTYFAFQYAVKPTTSQDLIDALDAAFDELIGIEVNYVYAPDVYLDANDAKTKDKVELVARFADTQSNQFRNVLAFVGTAEPTSYTFSGIKTWVNNLESVMTTIGTIKNASGSDIGHRVVIVAGHGTVNNVSASVVDLAPFVAAYIHKANIYTGPVNFALDGVTLLENLTLEQANKLAGARITAIYNKPGYSKKPMIIVGRTAANLNSPLTKISSILVINEYVNGLKEIADKYLGKPNSGTVRMSMQSTMQNYTNSFRQAGKIAGGTVTVEPDVTNGAINALNVKAQIRAFAEVEVINISVRFEYGVE